MSSSLAGLTSRVLGAVVDPTVVLSFDRTGYRIHSLGFREADLDVDLSGRVCLVTGANAGLGRETAFGLAARGADLWMLCRSRERGEAAADEVRQATGNARVRLETLDVSDLESVRSFCERFPEPEVHVLVNNAGVLPEQRQETPQGLELTFATNVVGPFLLTVLLEPRLRGGAPSRVINVSSGGMYGRRLQLGDPQWHLRAFDGVTAYAETKRAEVVLSELWAKRLADAGVSVNAMHPGWADTPGVRSSIPGFHRVMRRVLRTPREGADTILWLACCPGLEDRTGLFWFDREPRRTHWLPWTRETREERESLWRMCCESAGLDPHEKEV